MFSEAAAKNKSLHKVCKNALVWRNNKERNAWNRKKKVYAKPRASLHDRIICTNRNSMCLSLT